MVVLISTIRKIVQQMTAKIHQIFPTVVYQNNISVDNKDLLSALKDNNHIPVQYGTGELESKILLHKDPDLEDFFDVIVNEVGEYLDSFHILKSEYLIAITKSWASTSGNGNFVPRHHHSCAHLTFIYYVDLEDPVDPIWFCIDKNPNESFGDQFKSSWRKNEFNTNEVYFRVSEGDLFIFPGSLAHFTAPLNGASGKKRLSIAGDILLLNTKMDVEQGLMPPNCWKVF